jgi:hypothetical protein
MTLTPVRRRTLWRRRNGRTRAALCTPTPPTSHAIWPGGGIKVECIRRSKEENLFEDQKGAAWFRTNQGIFEVWFMPDAEAAAVVVAKVTSRSPPVYLPSGPSEFFIQYQNVVFHVSLGNRTLAASLQRAFQEP